MAISNEELGQIMWNFLWWQVMKIHTPWLWHANNYRYGDSSKFEIISDKFDIVRICIDGNYTQKWIVEECNYW